MRTLGRSLAVIGLVAVVSFAGAGSAVAHATYKSSNPADESTVSSAPSRITAEFTEPMANGSYMDVTDPCGRDSGSGSSQTGSSMSVQNTATAGGTYSVFWRAVSIDSHTTEGTFTFTVADGDPCPGEAEKQDPGSDGGGGGGSASRVGSGGSGGSGGSDGSVSDGGTGASTAAGSGRNHEGHPKGKGAGHRSGNSGRGKGEARGSGGNGAESGPFAGARSDVPDAPSAIDGIPIDGLLITLAVAALIGAAAGKIYVSLSGDDS